MQQSLNLRQQKFVVAYLRLGNGTQAAKEAGYKGNADYLAVQGSRLIRNDKVRAVLSEACASLNPERLKQLMAIQIERMPVGKWRWNHWLKTLDLYAKSTGMYKPQSQSMQVGMINLLQLRDRMASQGLPVSPPPTPSLPKTDAQSDDMNSCTPPL